MGLHCLSINGNSDFFLCSHSPCFQSRPALQPTWTLLLRQPLRSTPISAPCRPAWCPPTSCLVPPYWSPATRVPSRFQLPLPPLRRSSWEQTDLRWETHSCCSRELQIEQQKRKISANANKQRCCRWSRDSLDYLNLKDRWTALDLRPDVAVCRLRQQLELWNAHFF